MSGMHASQGCGSSYAPLPSASVLVWQQHQRQGFQRKPHDMTIHNGHPKRPTQPQLFPSPLVLYIPARTWHKGSVSGLSGRTGARSRILKRTSRRKMGRAVLCFDGGPVKKGVSKRVNQDADLTDVSGAKKCGIRSTTSLLWLACSALACIRKLSTTSLLLIPEGVFLFTV
jgi:hypothetical protein